MRGIVDSPHTMAGRPAVPVCPRPGLARRRHGATAGTCGGHLEADASARLVGPGPGAPGDGTRRDRGRGAEGRGVAGDKSTARAWPPTSASRTKQARAEAAEGRARCARRTTGQQPSVRGNYPGPGIVPDSKVLQRHSHPRNLEVGRGAATQAIGNDHAADRDAVPADSPTPMCVSLCPVISVLVRF